MAGRAVVIEDYDPGWPLRFAELCVPLREALGPLALRIEHVGSTAIPGLAAKPVIDMDVVIPSRRDLPEAIRRLAVIGYQHRGDLGIPGRETFANPAGLPEHHLYVCDRENAELRRHLLFRDHLRSYPAEASAYAALKRTLAERFGTDRDGYSLGQERLCARRPGARRGRGGVRPARRRLQGNCRTGRNQSATFSPAMKRPRLTPAGRGSSAELPRLSRAPAGAACPEGQPLRDDRRERPGRLRPVRRRRSNRPGNSQAEGPAGRRHSGKQPRPQGEGSPKE